MGHLSVTVAGTLGAGLAPGLSNRRLLGLAVDVFWEPSICGQCRLRCWFSDLLLPRALFPQPSQRPSRRPRFPLPRAPPPGPGEKIEALFSDHSYSTPCHRSERPRPGAWESLTPRSVCPAPAEPPPCLQQNRHSWPASPQASSTAPPSRKTSQGRATTSCLFCGDLIFIHHLLGLLPSRRPGPSLEDPSPSFSLPPVL